jgi:hypothetical protein
MNTKREKLLQEQYQKFQMRKEKLEYLTELNKKATPGPWIPMDLGQGLKRDADITLLVELRNNAEALIDSAKGQLWTEEWYAARIELLRDLCDRNGFIVEFCNIAANGKESVHSPPTYQQQMNLLKFAKEKAEEENKTYRSLLQEAADTLCSQHDPEDNLNMNNKIQSALESFEIEGMSTEK